MGRNVEDIPHVCSFKPKFIIVLFIAYQINALLNSTGYLFMGSYKQQGQKLVSKTGICYQRDNITLLLWSVVSDWRKSNQMAKFCWATSHRYKVSAELHVSSHSWCPWRNTYSPIFLPWRRSRLHKQKIVSLYAASGCVRRHPSSN